MFSNWYNRKFVRCDNFEPHKEHRWYPHWWSRTRVCFGVREDPWLKANPSFVGAYANNTIRAIQGLPPHEIRREIVDNMYKTMILPNNEYPPHKHRLQLTGWAGKIGRPANDPDERLYFSCKDGCTNPRGYLWQVEIPRWEYNTKVLAPKHFDQTWPG